MKEFALLLKKGNVSALTAGIVNLLISIIKGITYTMTGNVAMFAEMLHSFGDALNQGFVYIGSALSKKAPTKRFPNGFGRMINLVLLGAVLVVGIMSYETVKEGFHHIFHPTESKGFLINLTVLGLGFLLESFVLLKAVKEILHETGNEGKGVSQVFRAFPKAKPATKLVFLEDSVATSGGLLAMISVIISHTTGLHAAEGIASVLIGCMMFFVVGKTFLDNAAGVLGESDEEMKQHIGNIVSEENDVRDASVTVIKEGEALHVELEIELHPDMTIAAADNIKERIEKRVLEEKGVTDVLIAFKEDDGVPKWKKE